MKNVKKGNWILLLLSVSLISQGCLNKKTMDKEPVDADLVAITPPIEQLRPKYLSFDIDPTKEQLLKIESGTTIKIPANALVNMEGKAVSGTVQIKYREYHDAIDAFLSGIPMAYKVANKKSTFQTAGMFEIRGEQGGVGIQIASNKGIEVRLASFESGDDYSFFWLDEQGKGWEFVDYVKPEINLEKEKLKKRIQAPSLAFPLSPQYFTFNYMSIVDVMFKDDYYDIRNNAKNPAVSSKASKYGLSWLKVVAGDFVNYKGVQIPANMLVWRRLSGNNFPDWVKTEEGNYGELKALGGDNFKVLIYSENKNKKYEATIQAVMPLKSLLAFSPEYWINNYQKVMAEVEVEIERLKKEADVFRSFEIQGFGIYNYDRLMKEEDKIEVMASFSVQKSLIADNQLYEVEMVYCFPEDGKTLIKLPRKDWQHMVLLPNVPCKFITVLPNQKIAVFGAEEYSNINFEALRKDNKPKFEIEFQKTSETVESVAKLKAAMNL